MNSDYSKTRTFPLLLVCYELSNYLANDAYLPALPQLAHDLSIDANVAQLTLTVFFMGTAMMQLIFGPITDRVGRRPVLLGSGLFFITATLLCATTANIHLFLGARFIQGTAITAMLVSGYATVHELFEHKQAIKTLAWMGAITVLAPAFGPLLGSVILLFSGWRTIFIILAVWASIALIGLYYLMPETCTEFKPIAVKSIAKSYWNVVCNPRFIIPAMTLCFLFALMIAWIAAGPFIVMERFNYTPMMFGVLQAFIFSSYIFGTRWVNRLIGRHSIKSIMTKALIITFIFGSSVLVLIALFPRSLFDVIVPMMGIAFGSGLSFAVLNRTAIEASTESMGVTMAVFSTFMGLSCVLGSGIVGTSFFDGYITEFAIIVFSLSLLASIFYLVTLKLVDLEPKPSSGN